MQRYLSDIPLYGRVWHKAFFKVNPGTGCSPDMLSIPINASGPHWPFPKMGCLRRHAISLIPLWSVKAWGDGSPRLKVFQRRETPDQIRAIDTMAGRSVTHLLDSVDWNQPRKKYHSHSYIKGIRLWGSFKKWGEFGGLRKGLVYVHMRFIKEIGTKFFDWGGTYDIYEGHSINKRNFFDWRGTYDIYEGHSIKKGNFLTEEGHIIYMRVIQ